MSVLMMVGVVLSLLASPGGASTAAVPPPTSPIVIEVVKMNGSGCRAHSAAAAFSADRTAFTVTYSGYLAQIGGGVKPKEAQKYCNLDVRFDLPAGYSYAVTNAQYRGFGLLESGARGTQVANYYFHGGPRPVDQTHQFAGPYDDQWVHTDTVSAADQRWAPCGKSHKLQIDTTLQLEAGTSDPATTLSMLTMDSTDGVLSSTYNLSWKRC